MEVQQGAVDMVDLQVLSRFLRDVLRHHSKAWDTAVANAGEMLATVVDAIQALDRGTEEERTGLLPVRPLLTVRQAEQTYDDPPTIPSSEQRQEANAKVQNALQDLAATHVNLVHNPFTIRSRSHGCDAEDADDADAFGIHSAVQLQTQTDPGIARHFHSTTGGSNSNARSCSARH
eukprot:s118_g37.t1